MSTVFDNLLEPLAVDMAKAEPNMRVREVAQMSTAVSAKRQADALEKIAHAMSGQDQAGSILYWLENIASAAQSGVGR